MINFKSRSLYFMAVFLFVLVLSCGSATAATINVNPGTNAIQKAITNANSGDTLNLSAGTYQEHDLDVNKNLTITGPTNTGTPTAIIDAQQQGRAFNILTGTNVTLQYLIIENGDATKDTDTQYGGAIQNQGTLNIKSCKITKNTATYGGGICNYVTCTVNVAGSSINGNTATSGYGGGIFNDGTCTVNVAGSSINGNTANLGGGGFCNYGTATVADSTINSNTSPNGGGGIFNYGTVNVAGSSINGNTATSGYGGGIFNYGTVTVTGSTINSNTATGSGGGIFNSGTVNVAGSSINGNTATYYGGGICNYGTCTVTGCDFAYNKATTNGNAIYNNDGTISDRIIHFCRFYDPASGYEIYSNSGSVDAMFNWWGSNDDPSSKVYGAVNTNPWLVLKISASPTLIGKNLTSIIIADITHDSAGGTHTLATGPNGIPVTFTTTLGSITNPISTLNGASKATLTAGSIAGIADVDALLDDEIIYTSVTFETTAPMVSSMDPANGVLINDASKKITVTFSEAVKFGTGTIQLLRNGTSVSFSKSITGNKLILTPTVKLVNGVYTVILNTGSVTDNAGNPLTLYHGNFTVDTVAPKVTSTTPTNYKTGVTRTGVIAIKFSENIYSSIYYNKITVKNLTTGKTTTITKAINGNTLYIKNTTTRSANNWYQVTIPAAAVKDKAGNILTTAYTFKFKTG